MTWEELYTAPTPTAWQCRHDGPEASRYGEVIRLVDVTKGLPQSNFAIIGFCSDAGIVRNQGRPGAAAGPKALRQALSSRAFHGNVNILDLGDITCRHNDLEEAQSALAAVVALAKKAGMKTIALGGGHEVAWGHYQGLVAANPKQNIGIINIDSHYDLRPLLEGGKGSSGTPFTQMAIERQQASMPFNYLCIGIQPLSNTKALFDTAQSLGVTTILADDILQHGVAAAIAAIDDILKRCEVVYVSLDLDVFSAAHAPGVSAPQPLGLPPWLVSPLIAHLATSDKIIGFDVAELSPTYDSDSRTATLAASMLAAFVS